MTVLYRRFRNPKTAPKQLQAKLFQRHENRALARDMAKEIIALRDDAEPRMILEKDIGPLPEPSARRLKAIKRKHLAVFHRVYPLLPDETVEAEAYAVLAEDWGEFPKGTVAVVRETSICREVHLFPYIRFEHPDLVVLPDEELAPPGLGQFMVGAAMVGAAPPIFATLARTLGDGLVKGITGVSAGPLFEKLFPPGAPDWVGTLCTEIRQIVRGEIEQARISTMRGKLEECSDHMRDFNAQKAKGVPFAKCRHDLRKAYDLVVEVQNQLQEIGDAGLNVYCIASGQRFLVMQELAFDDPDFPRSPGKSPWSERISAEAKRAADCGLKCFNSIIQTRLRAITEIDGMAMPPHAHWRFWFNDTVTGQHFTSQGHARCFTADNEQDIRWNNISQQRRDHCQAVETAMKTQLAGVTDSINAWRLLVKDPLPPPSKTSGG